MSHHGKKMSLVRSPSPQLRRNTRLQSTGEGAGIVTVVLFYVIEVNIIMNRLEKNTYTCTMLLQHLPNKEVSGVPISVVYPQSASPCTRNLVS